MTGQPGSGPPLYWRVLGADFARLPVPVKALHDNPGRVVACGRCRVERGGNPLARLLAALFGFPPAGDDVPLRVQITAEGAGERWERNFAGHRLASLQSEVPGRPGWLYERFGPGHFTIDPRPSERGLSFALTGARLFGLALPRWLWPAVTGDATAPDGFYRFEVSIALPVVGIWIARLGGNAEQLTQQNGIRRLLQRPLKGHHLVSHRSGAPLQVGVYNPLLPENRRWRLSATPRRGT